MLSPDISDKLKILAGAAKYDVSCSSSGSNRQNNGNGFGNSISAGICHSFTEDGRCISLLKILFSNYCIYDCAYCINRKSNDIKRATFKVEEIVDITINFYRRNYIEGLFLSSGVIKNPDYTMELLTRVAKEIRNKEKFFGYIHLKAIPGASNEILKEAGLYADRLSVNIEIPTEPNLKLLAPDKNFHDVYNPMRFLKEGIIANKEERKLFRNAQMFVPAGQSTQLIIGATPENDLQIVNLASNLYKNQNLKRVYYSAFSPVNDYDKRLPAITQSPLVRENRLYQADWLMRFYKFSAEELVNDNHPDLELEIDPKLSYALRNIWQFPVDINSADYEMILRVPGIGVRSAKLIVSARRYGKLNFDNLKKIGVVLKRAKYFIICAEVNNGPLNLNPIIIKNKLLEVPKSLKKVKVSKQLELFG